MLHILPVLCLIGFAFFVEYRLNRELNELRRDIRKLKKRINNEKRTDN